MPKFDMHFLLLAKKVLLVVNLGELELPFLDETTADMNDRVESVASFKLFVLSFVRPTDL